MKFLAEKQIDEQIKARKMKSIGCRWNGALRSEIIVNRLMTDKQRKSRERKQQRKESEKKIQKIGDRFDLMHAHTRINDSNFCYIFNVNLFKCKTINKFGSTMITTR